MKSFSLYAFIVGLQSIVSVGAAGNFTSNSTQAICSTQFGSSSLAIVPTSTHTSTLQVTVYSTFVSQQTVTFTPAPVTLSTTTILSTTLTANATIKTDTYTSGITFTQTNTRTTTITSTFTSTTLFTTSQQATVTQPSKAGFTPLASSIPGAGLRKRSTIEERRNQQPVIEPELWDENEDEEDDACGPSYTIIPKPPSQPQTSAGLGNQTTPLKLTCGKTGRPSPTFSPHIYPTSVDCQSTVQNTATITTTSAAQETSTVTGVARTVNTTVLETSTFYATFTPVDASTTVTTSTTITSSLQLSTTTSTTVTTSITTTVVLPSATTYAQCQSNNIITSVNGATVGEVDFLNNILSSSSSASAYDCCVTCSTNAVCGGFTWVSGACYLQNDKGGVCNGAVTSWQFFTSGDSGTGLTVGNGACGQGSYQGNE